LRALGVWGRGPQRMGPVGPPNHLCSFALGRPPCLPSEVNEVPVFDRRPRLVPPGPSPQCYQRGDSSSLPTLGAVSRPEGSPTPGFPPHRLRGSIIRISQSMQGRDPFVCLQLSGRNAGKFSRLAGVIWSRRGIFSFHFRDRFPKPSGCKKRPHPQLGCHHQPH